MKKLILITALLASSSSWGACISGNCINGIGTLTWTSGNKYVGEWKDDKMYGLGTYTWTDGTSDTGYWLKGKFIPDICEDMGLTKGSDGFSQCVLKLMDD